MANRGDAKKSQETAQETAKPTQAVPPSKTSPNVRLNLLALLLILSASANASQALISPLYGYEITSTWFRLGAFLAVSLFAVVLPESEKSHSNALTAVIALQIFGTALSRTLGFYVGNALEDPTIAATVVHAVVAFPILGLGGVVWLDWMRKFSEQEEATRAGELVIKAASIFAFSACVGFLENLFGLVLTYLPDVHPKYIMGTLALFTAALQLSTQPSSSGSIRSSLTSPSISTLTTVSLIVVSLAITFPPTPPSIIDVYSTRFGGQGLVQVADIQQTPLSLPVRYLRKDAAIIGSSYLVPVLEEAPKLDIGETAERKALLLDGVRLVKGVKGKSALVIGAGTGAITSQLVAHNYNTTLIESDPEVVDAARKFFKLREPAEVHVDDAAVWLERSAGVGIEPTHKFDIVIHDVVLGGIAPPQLFTMEFWETLTRVVDEKGIVAVAFTGTPSSQTFKSILNMLLNNFSTCRVHHTSTLDSAPFAPAASSSKVTDFVIFCTAASTLKFRSAGYADYTFNGIPSRERLLRTFAQREISIDKILGETPRDRLLLRRADPRLNKWGKNAVEVWKYTREIYPAEIWSTY